MKLRQEVWSKCENESLDLIIVGGGINGAGILRDALMRGLKAVLLEQHDFASGTSSKSSKLIHGGLRYLETFDFKLVFEATHERKILLNIAPKMVRPLPFIFPVFKGQRRNLFEVTVGVWLYNFLAGIHNIHHPSTYLKKNTLKLVPLLRKDGLAGSAVYFDAITNDVSLTEANLRSAWELGGLAINHAKVLEFIEGDNKISGVIVRDERTQQTYSLHARWIVNVTGPWSDALMKASLKNAEPRLRLTKGVHLIIPKSRLSMDQALVMLSPKDGRVTFLIPWENEILLGTTDTDFNGDPSDVFATSEDVEYLLEITNYYFPSAKLQRSDVLSTFAGLRPLLSDDRNNPSQVSREHQILEEKPGLVTMVGGKLTTYRQMAEELLDWIFSKTPEWGSRLTPCNTASTPLFVHTPPYSTNDRIRIAVQHEMACTLTDILAHRLWLVYTAKDHGLSYVSEAKKVLQTILGLSDAEISKQMKDLEQVIKKAMSGLT